MWVHPSAGAAGPQVGQLSAAGESTDESLRCVDVAPSACLHFEGLQGVKQMPRLLLEYSAASDTGLEDASYLVGCRS